jgi:hypothetical protein
MPPRLPAADVQAARFNVTRRGGYEERTMDEVLDHYAHELDKLAPQPPAADTDPALRPSRTPQNKLRGGG